jgi:hypothetical protein
MITEDRIAAATIAQLFGSELLHLQSKAQTDAGTVPQMVTMDPKQFLFDSQATQQMSHQRREQERRLMHSLQQEAEAAYPIEQIEQPPLLSQPVLPQPVDQLPPLAISPPVAAPSGYGIGVQHSNVWERIAVSLEKISACLEHTKPTISKIRKRKPKKTT